MFLPVYYYHYKQDCKRSDKDTHYMSSGEIQDQ
jgi:hypothetical protein